MASMQELQTIQALQYMQMEFRSARLMLLRYTMLKVETNFIITFGYSTVFTIFRITQVWAPYIKSLSNHASGCRQD